MFSNDNETEKGGSSRLIKKLKIDPSDPRSVSGACRYDHFNTYTYYMYAYTYHILHYIMYIMLLLYIYIILNYFTYY